MGPESRGFINTDCVDKSSGLSLYVHVPFCLKKCNYCGFYSEELRGSTGPNRIDTAIVDTYIESLEAEIKSYGGNFKSRRIVSLYIGGGTPTTLTADQLIRLMSALREEFSLSWNVEITIEANPETLTLAKARQLKDIGINRISIGVQSFNDEALKKLGRIHGSKRAKDAYNVCRTAGFSNISIDLMFGYTGQTAADFRSDLMQVISLSPEHISLYALSIDRESMWSKEMEQSECNENDPDGRGGFLLDADLTADMYDIARSILKRHGYGHYEISNFSKPSFRSRHNEGYWLRREYIGLGASAASLISNTRRVNPSNLDEYNAMIEANAQNQANADLQTNVKIQAITKISGREETTLTPAEIREEIMFLGLRRLDGISKSRVRQYDLQRHFGDEIEELRSLGMIVGNGDLRLSSKALFISNEVLCKFIQAGG